MREKMKSLYPSVTVKQSADQGGHKEAICRSTRYREAIYRSTQIQRSNLQINQIQRGNLQINPDTKRQSTDQTRYREGICRLRLYHHRCREYGDLTFRAARDPLCVDISYSGRPA